MSRRHAHRGAVLLILGLGLVSPRPGQAADPCWCLIEPGFQNVGGQDYANNGVFIGFPAPVESCPELKGIRELTLSDGSVGTCSGVPFGAGFCFAGTPASDGPYTATAKCWPKSGGAPYSRDFPFLVDLTPPRLVVTEPQDGAIFGDRTYTFSGTVSDDLTDVRDVNAQGIIIPIGARSGSWSIPIFSPGPGDGDTIRLIVATADLLGNSTFATRDFTWDTIAPEVHITTPVANSVIPVFSEISGTAKDTTALESLTISVRENLTGLYWNGAAFLETAPRTIALPLPGPSHAWSYPPLAAGALINGTSYTVMVQGTDTLGNVSRVIYSTFTYDVCEPGSEPTFVFREQVPDIVSRLSLSCEALNCGRSALVTGTPPTYEFPAMTAPQLNTGVALRCTDESRLCPLTDGTSSPGGAFGALKLGIGGGRASNQGSAYLCGDDQTVRASMGGTVVASGPFDLGASGDMGEARVIESPSGSAIYLFFGNLASSAGAATLPGTPVSPTHPVGQCGTAGGGPPGLRVEAYHLDRALVTIGRTVKEIYAMVRLAVAQGFGKKVDPDIGLGCRKSGRQRNHVSMHVQQNIAGAKQPRLVDVFGDNLDIAAAIALSATVSPRVNLVLNDTAGLEALILHSATRAPASVEFRNRWFC